MSAWKSAFKWVTIVSLLFLAIPIKIPPPVEKIQFDQYIGKFNKTYIQGTEEYHKRYMAFRHTLQMIDKLNADRPHNETARYGLTPFSDLTEEEFIELHLDRARQLTKKRQHRKKHRKIPENNMGDEMPQNNIDDIILYSSGRYKRQTDLNDLPQKIDWREQKVISPVRDQGLCGACWAYSTIHTIESVAAIKNKKLVPLSVQQSIDCARNGNLGCSGGDICNLLDWLAIKNVTLATETDYPLIGKGNVCHESKPSSNIKVKDFSCGSLVNKEENILNYLATVGPVAVAINALSWQNYLGGVIQYHCSGDVFSLNHAVEIVGYDLTAEIPHYIAKNSWGTHFGLDGYLHLAIGGNICGLANEVATVDLV